MQRYFITAESTYEDLRQSLNTQLAYPNALGKSVFQTALQAPRDSFRRVLLAVDTDIQGYATIAAAITPLLDSDAMEEVDEATYLAAVQSSPASGGSSAWADITGKPSTFTPSAHTHTASAITDFSDAVAAASPEEVVEYLAPANFPATGNSSLLYVATDDSRQYRWTGSQYVEVGAGGGYVAGLVRSDAVGLTFYVGRSASGTATSEPAWTIRRTILTSAGAVSSTATATNVRWDDRLTASYS